MSGFTANAARKQARKQAREEHFRTENNRYQLCFREVYCGNAEFLRVMRAADKAAYIPKGRKSFEEIALSRIRKEAMALHEANEELGYLQRINPERLVIPRPRRDQQPHERDELERSYEEERCYQQCFLELYFANADLLRVARAADKFVPIPEDSKSIEEMELSRIRKKAIARQQANEELRRQQIRRDAIQKARIAIQEIHRQDALEQEYRATAAYLEQRAPAPAGSSTLIQRLSNGN